MKTSTVVSALLGIAICFGSTINAQDNRARLLRGAAHCLDTKDFLANTKASKLTFGYLLDEKSYPGQRVLYVVNYPNPSRSDGLVFTIFVAEHDGREEFNIQNNARFALSRHGDVTFVTPPLGGTWTHEHLVSAVEQIEKQSRFTITANGLLKSDPSVPCEAYRDPQPSAKAK